MPHPSITAQTYPHKPAIIMGDSGEMVTYRQLDERSNQGAQLFRSLGLKTGDHIGMMIENDRQFLEIAWAAQRSGLVFTPISTHLKKDETAYILENCGAKLFVGSLHLAEVAEQLLAEATGVEHFYMINGIKPGFESWEEATDAQATTPIDDQAYGVAMLYSSGTTGKPKGVFIPPHDTAFDADPLIAPTLGSAFGFSEETVYLSPAPLYHAAPLHYNMMNQFMGGTSVIMEKFDPEKALALIEEHRATHSQWVPIMFIRMLKLPKEVRDRYDISSMQVAIHAAAPCPVEIKEQMINWWGEVIVEYYGASEGAGFTIIDSANWLTHKGSVGPALLGKIHIVDDDGNELPVGEIGTIYFSGEQARFEYHREPEKTHHRRCRLPGRGRLPLPYRPQELHDHQRRGEHLSPGDREYPGEPREGGGRRRVRHSPRGIRRAGAGQDAEGAGLPPEAAAHRCRQVVQAPPGGRVPRRGALRRGTGVRRLRPTVGCASRTVKISISVRQMVRSAHPTGSPIQGRVRSAHHESWQTANKTPAIQTA
jgi:fatty-acyl-CoA synthase